MYFANSETIFRSLGMNGVSSLSRPPRPPFAGPSGPPGAAVNGPAAFRPVAPSSLPPGLPPGGPKIVFPAPRPLGPPGAQLQAGLTPRPLGFVQPSPLGPPQASPLGTPRASPLGPPSRATTMPGPLLPPRVVSPAAVSSPTGSSTPRLPGLTNGSYTQSSRAGTPSSAFNSPAVTYDSVVNNIAKPPLQSALSPVTSGLSPPTTIGAGIPATGPGSGSLTPSTSGANFPNIGLTVATPAVQRTPEAGTQNMASAFTGGTGRCYSFKGTHVRDFDILLLTLLLPLIINRCIAQYSQHFRK
jgi:hypothetical protein